MARPKIGTNFAEKRRLLGRYSSLADCGPRSFFFLWKVKITSIQKTSEDELLSLLAQSHVIRFITYGTSSVFETSGVAFVLVERDIMNRNL
jgi:hypothetical protein